MSETEAPSDEMKLIASEVILLLIVDLRQCMNSQKRMLNVNIRETVLSQMQRHENYLSEIMNALRNWILLAG